MHRNAVSVTNLTPAGGASAEQVIMTIPTPTLWDNPLNASVGIDAVIQSWTDGGGGTTPGVTFKVRRTSLVGTQVGASVVIVGLTTTNLPIHVLDLLTGAGAAFPYPLQYVITAQQTGAPAPTSNGNLAYAVASVTIA